MAETEPLPNTVSYLAYHAQKRPNDIALIDNGQKITFGMFFMDVCRMRRFIQSYEIEQDGLVAVQSTQFYLSWLVLLACESLQIKTVSFTAQEVAYLKEILDKAQLIVGNPMLQTVKRKCDVVMDAQWFKSVHELEPDLSFDPRYPNPAVSVRLVKSSGTTGKQKFMEQSALSHEFRSKHCQYFAGFNKESRLLLAMEFSVQSMHGYAMTCLRMGGMCIMDSTIPMTRALQTYQATHIAILPVNLAQFVNHVSPSDKDIVILSGGASISKKLRQEIHQKLKAKLVESYGANEVGYICSMDERARGTVMPDIQVEVVDKRGKPVIGAKGQVRVKSPAAVQGYVNDADASAHMFIDGWFYPGDMGVMEDATTLRLLGREDNLFNFGGIKYPVAFLEGQLQDRLPIEDACLIESNEALYVFVIPESQDAIREIQAMIYKVLPQTLHRTSLVFVKEIPRTDTGKVQRWKLMEKVKPKFAS